MNFLRAAGFSYGQTTIVVLFIASVLIPFGCQRAGSETGETASMTAQRRCDPVAVPWPRKWHVAPRRSNAPPPIRFRFPPPLNEYSGEVSLLKGDLTLGEGGSLAEATGAFEVDIAHVTMGEPDLDENMRNNVEALESKRFPQSRFVLQRIQSTSPALEPETAVPAILQGTFELKGVKTPLAAMGTIRAMQDAAGAARLEFDLRFRLEQLQEKFGIVGPSGPQETAGNQLFFELHFVMEPAPPE